MMKRVLMMSYMLIVAMVAMADDGYPYLTFQTADGTEQSMAVDQLTIVFVDGLLVATGAEGDQTIALDDMRMMYFSQTAATPVTTAIETARTADDDEAVTAYTTDGRLAGRFDTVKQAKATLRPGIYVMKTNSKTFKTTVK